MSISSSFLWRFLDDVWDLLPTEDRELFQAYWLAQIRIGANLEQKALEASLSNEISEVPVFLTERWNRFVMDEDTCDLFEQSDSLELSGTAGFSLSRETAFYDTLVVSNASGQISHEETMQFFDGSVRGLRYGKIITGAISVTLGGQEYTPNRDYVVNLEEGTIQALDGGRIPTTELCTITYQHSEYTRDLDYELNEVRGTIARIAGTTISSGATVVVAYTYNGTATLPMQGTGGAVSGAILTDETKDFSSLLSGRMLTISSGPNAGTYSINSVLGPTQIQIAENFPQAQVTDVVYSIDAFPHGMRVGSTIVSIPFLQDLVGNPTVVFVEDVDYRVSAGILSVRTAFDKSTIGPTDIRERQAWAEESKLDHETPYRNFGVLIDFYRQNSEAYKLALQGLWYTFWTGSTPGNLQRGLHILLGLPYARRAGTVSRVDTVAAEIDITEASGRILTYSIPDGLTAVVARDDEVVRFARLTTGVQIIDRNNEPGFVASRLGRAGITRFLTSNATLGTTPDTDESKALALLEHHLFLPQVLTEAISQRINVDELVTFLDNMKPKWTEYIFSFAVEEEETLTLSEIYGILGIEFDLTTTVSNNELNRSFLLDEFIAHKHTGEILEINPPVTWIDDQNVAIDGNNLEKDAGGSAWNAGAISNRSVASGDCCCEFTTDENNKDKTCGLSNGDTDQGADDVDFRIIAHGSGSVYIYEGAVWKAGPISPYVAGDIFRVQVTGGVVTYWHNGVLLYTSGGSPSYPLLVDCSLYHVGATLKDVEFRAIGNFRDFTVDFAALGIDEGDFIRIVSGLYKGVHRVLARQSQHILSLDIPDASLQSVLSIEYQVLTEEQSRLDHDSIQLRREHIVLPGTDFLAPSTLNTKSDAYPKNGGLKNKDVKALLLVDLGNVGDEVQAITDADANLQEFDVANPPGTVTRDHELASTALKRRNNFTATVTHAYAI